jgi:uncharacterized membrane protein HdeD (DUF308 family)
MAGTQEVKSWGDFLVTGIVMAVIGLLMIIFQAGSLNIILIIFGVLLLIGGALNVFSGIRYGDNIGIVSGVIQIVLGIAMVIATNFVSDILMVILAIGLIIVGASNALGGLKAGLEVKERILPIAVGAAFLVVGIVALFNLNDTADIVMIVIGVITLLGGLLDVYSAFKLKTM